MNKNLRGYILVITSGVFFGVNPIFSRLLYGTGMNVLSVLTQRNIITMISAFLLLHFAFKVDIRVSWADFKRLFVIALFANLFTSILLQTSYLYIPSGMSTTLHFVYPIVTVVEGALFFHDKIGRVKWICVACCSLGIVMFYTPGGSVNWIGVVLALTSGITFGTYMVLLNHIGLSKMPAIKITFYNCFFGLIFHGGYAVLTNNLYIPFSAYTIGLGCMSTILSSLLASSFLQYGIRHIGSQRSAILSTCEPLTSILLGITIYNDQFNIKTGFGIVLILASVVMLTLFDRDKEEVPAGAEVEN